MIDVSSNFYSSHRWLKKKASILKRDGFICQNCKRYGKLVQANVVHHIKHFDEFPELALANDNLISLCSACHNKAHPEKGGKR